MRDINFGDIFKQVVQIVTFEGSRREKRMFKREPNLFVFLYFILLFWEEIIK
jgi:hypothetical protein